MHVRMRMYLIIHIFKTCFLPHHGLCKLLSTTPYGCLFNMRSSPQRWSPVFTFWSAVCSRFKRIRLWTHASWTRNTHMCFAQYPPASTTVAQFRFALGTYVLYRVWQKIHVSCPLFSDINTSSYALF